MDVTASILVQSVLPSCSMYTGRPYLSCGREHAKQTMQYHIRAAMKKTVLHLIAGPLHGKPEEEPNAVYVVRAVSDNWLQACMTLEQQLA